MHIEFLEIVGNGSPTGSVVKETIAVSAAISISVEKLHHQIRFRILSCSRMSENHREPEVPEEKSPSGRMFRWPCKDYLKGTCNNSFCERWHPPECLFHKTKSGCRFGEKCAYAHRQVDEQPTERSKKNDAKVQWLYRRRVIGMNEDLLPTDVTIDRGNLMRGTVVPKKEKFKESGAKTEFSCIAEADNPQNKELIARQTRFIKVTLQGRNRILLCVAICSPDNFHLEKDQT